MIKQHRDARSSRCAHPTAAAMPTSATSTLPIAFLLHSLAGRAAHEAHAHVTAGRAFVVVQQRLPDLPTLLGDCCSRPLGLGAIQSCSGEGTEHQQ